MRNRFFVIILTALVFAAVSINLVHVYFFKSQRLKLIDRQINESSSTLLASSEFISSVENSVMIEEKISQVLEGARIGKIFVVRGEDGKILYQSFNVGLLKMDLPIHPEWVAVQTPEEYVRIRNSPLPGADGLILQVGLVLDRNFLNWEILDYRVIVYVTGIVLALFFASAILTWILLSPLRLLISHLREATSSLLNMKAVKPLPSRILKYADGFWGQSDEFSSLVNTIQKLINRINSNYKLTRSWSFQMAHELKTPLAIMRAEAESKKKLGLLPESYVRGLFKEIHQMSDIINQFLDWAELENSQGQKDLHALQIKAVIKEVASRLDKIGHGRLHLDLNSDFPVFANPIHLDQLLSNLVTNALKFSPNDSRVDLELGDHLLIVRDRGTGISKEIMERLGQPFNLESPKEGSKSGSGLGLAWVATVAKIYQWELEIKTSKAGTEVRVGFPQTSEE